MPFPESKDGQTQFCRGCEEEARGNKRPYLHTCRKEVMRPPNIPFDPMTSVVDLTSSAKKIWKERYSPKPVDSRDLVKNSDGSCNCRPLGNGCFFTDWKGDRCDCKCHSPKPEESGWEDEFYNIFLSRESDWSDYSFEMLVKTLKSFISKTVASTHKIAFAEGQKTARAHYYNLVRKEAREDMKRKIEELAQDPPLESNERRRGYHQAIDDVLSSLTDTE